MNLKLQEELFHVLEERVREIKMETNRVPGGGSIQVGDTLRLLVPINDEGDPVLMELMVVKLAEDADMLQFFTTMLTDLDEKQYGRVHQALEEWNIGCPVGSFGVYLEQRQLYHKYGALYFEEQEQDVQKMADYAIDILITLYETLSAHYPRVVRCALGKE